MRNTIDIEVMYDGKNNVYRWDAQVIDGEGVETDGVLTPKEAPSALDSDDDWVYCIFRAYRDATNCSLDTEIEVTLLFNRGEFQ